MASDIMTFLQAFTDAYTVQTQAQTQTTDSQAEPGVFDAFMAEYTQAVTSTVQVMAVPAETEEHTVTFLGKNTFAQSVLEILAGTQEDEEVPAPEVIPAADDSQEDDGVIWPTDTEPEQHETPPPAQPKQVVRDIAAKVRNVVREILGSADMSDDDIDTFLERFFSDENVEAFTERLFPDGDVEAFAERFLSDGEVETFAANILSGGLTVEIPEALRAETAHVIEEAADFITQNYGTDEHPVMKMLAALSERITPKKDEPVPVDEEEPADETQDSDEPEDSPEIQATNFERAGLAGVIIPMSQPVQFEVSSQIQPDILEAPVRQKQVMPTQTQTRQARAAASENAGKPEKSRELPDNTQEARPSFRDVFADRNTEREGTGQNDTPGQDQNEEQPRGNTGTPTTTAPRSRTGRTETSRTQTEGTTTASTRRTESRSDFASFFQGVLTARRTASTSSPLPLDLRGTTNFSQAVTLRDGITNVVRFIRADGVQKARVVVDPPALGRISVELTNGTSGVEASIKVASEQIRQLVQDQLTELRMNLSQQGVQVAEFTVDVFTGQQGNTGQQQNNPQQQERGVFDFIGNDDEDDTEEFRVDLEEGLLWWVA